MLFPLKAINDDIRSFVQTPRKTQIHKRTHTSQRETEGSLSSTNEGLQDIIFGFNSKKKKKKLSRNYKTPKWELLGFHT